jgi:hypothetical protein
MPPRRKPQHISDQQHDASNTASAMRATASAMWMHHIAALSTTGRAATKPYVDAATQTASDVHDDRVYLDSGTQTDLDDDWGSSAPADDTQGEMLWLLLQLRVQQQQHMQLQQQQVDVHRQRHVQLHDMLQQLTLQRAQKQRLLRLIYQLEVVLRSIQQQLDQLLRQQHGQQHHEQQMQHELHLETWPCWHEELP